MFSISGEMFSTFYASDESSFVLSHQLLQSGVKKFSVLETQDPVNDKLMLTNLRDFNMGI